MSPWGRSESRSRAEPAEAPGGPGAPAPAEVSARVEALVAGDRGAVAWLYDTFSRELYRRIQGRYGGHPGVEPEDLLHDALVFFVQNEGKVLRDYLDRTPALSRTVESLGRCLWDLTCGLVANRKRSLRRRPTLPLISADRPTQGADPERRLLGRDQLAKLDRCLRERGERVYLYFKLRYEDGLAPREIVRATGWSTKATYKRKQALQKALAACWLRLIGGVAPGPDGTARR